MLRTSKLLSFLDEKNNFQLRFLEGQKIINDLAIIHDVKMKGFEFFRELVLTNIHLISTLKNREGLGLFVDSNDPYFRFKLECSENGHLRTLLFPEDLNVFPKSITGELRYVKLFSGRNTPYTSIIALEDKETKELTNSFLKDSHQANARVFLSDDSDQSIYIAKLPPRSGHSGDEGEDLSLMEYWDNNKDFLNDLMSQGINDKEKLVNDLSHHGLTFLQSKEIIFDCPCSEEKMKVGVQSLINTEGKDEVFQELNELEVTCDYCKSKYTLSKNDF